MQSPETALRSGKPATLAPFVASEARPSSIIILYSPLSINEYAYRDDYSIGGERKFTRKLSIY